jgi:hypothetical protein
MNCSSTSACPKNNDGSLRALDAGQRHPSTAAMYSNRSDRAGPHGTGPCRRVAYAPSRDRLAVVASSRLCSIAGLDLAVDVYRIDVSLVEVGGLLCLLVVVVAVIAAGVFIGTRLAQRRR